MDVSEVKTKKVNIIKYRCYRSCQRFWWWL